jgi:glucosyl-3-phosphoglycerate synthase
MVLLWKSGYAARLEVNAMADFYQTGDVTTLHRLKAGINTRMERELHELADHVSIGLVLPALYSEFETPSMGRIAGELAKVSYLRHIVVSLGRADANQYGKVVDFFEGFPHKVTILWVDSPEIQNLLSILDDKGLSAGPDGKGRSCWLAYGYLLSRECDVIALHDCDIVNYQRNLLSRLLYPVANPNLAFEFCKGYYARVTDRMHGRVTRLFLTPLIRALGDMAPKAPFLRFLDSFRYALAGEFSMNANLARVNRIPSDWGLEVGVLAEVYRNCAVARVCQVDLAESYEHKHQDLSRDDPNKGLRRMACDVAKSLLRTLAAEGLVFTRDHFRNLQVRYVRMAEDTINRYYADALLNGLEFDRHHEEAAVATFAESLRQAASEFVDSPIGCPQIPNWNRVVSAIPDYLDCLSRSVDPDAPGVRKHAC